MNRVILQKLGLSVCVFCALALAHCAVTADQQSDTAVNAEALKGHGKGKPGTGDGKGNRLSGLVAHYYRDTKYWGGAWPDSVSVPAVLPEDWTFTKYAYSRVEPLINHRFVNEGWFTVRWVGYLDTAAARRASDGEDAEYTFVIWADDGCRLTIDGVILIDDWKPCWDRSPESRRRSRTIKLTDGRHRIVVDYFQGQSLKHQDHDPMKLMWTSPDRGIKKATIVPAAYFSHDEADLKRISP